MPSEDQNKISKTYSFADNPKDAEKGFVNNLQDGINWANDSSEEWAKLKTYDLPKELIMFNLGILAFIGALRDDYISWVLVVVSILCSFSIIISFLLIRWVTSSNINNITKRRMIIQKTLDSYITGVPFKDLYNIYSTEMAAAQGELKGISKLWKYFDNIPMVLFIGGMIFAVVGFFIK